MQPLQPSSSNDLNLNQINSAFQQVRQELKKIHTNTAPATLTSPGHPGQFTYNDDYIYVCTEPDVWQRVAFAGAGDPPYKFVLNASRSFDAASGDQTIAHGFGDTPTYVRIEAMVVAGSTEASSVGTYDGTDMKCINRFNDNVSTDSDAQSTTSFVVQLRESGTLRQEATIAVNSTNVVLSWTRAGSTSAGTIRLLITVW